MLFGKNYDGPHLVIDMSNHEVLLMLNLDGNIAFYKTLGFDSSFAPSNLKEDNYRKFLV